MLSASLRSIADLCGSNPSARKVFVVPPGLSTNLARGLAAGGAKWANALFVTPRDLAMETCRAELMAGGLKQLHRDELSLWMYDNLPELASQPGSFFAGVQFGPALIRSFVTVIEAARLAAVTPEQIRRVDIRTDKKTPLASVLEAYEAYLKSANLYDDAYILDRASVLIPLVKPAALLCVIGETSVSARARSFLEAVPADAKTVLCTVSRYRSPDSAANVLSGWLQVGAGRQVEVAERGKTRATSSPDAESSLVPSKGSPSSGLSQELTPGAKPSPSAELYSIETLAPEHEVDSVLTDILSRGLRLDEVEIAYTSPKYLPIIASGLARLRHNPASAIDQSVVDFPASFSDGMPITQTYVGQALVNFLQWLAGGQQAIDLANLAQTRALTFRGIKSVEKLHPDQVSGFLLRRQVGAGKSSTMDALEMWKIELERGRYRREKDIVLVEKLRAGLTKLFAIVPADDIVTADALTKCLQQFLKKFVHAENDRDRSVGKLLGDQLSPLARSDARGSLENLSAFFLDLLRRRRTPGSSATSGALNVVPLSKSGFSGRRHLFVIGLDEQTFPGSTADDPVLLDEERRQLSPLLPTRTLMVRRRLDAFDRAVVSATGSFTAVYSFMDPIFGREVERATALDALLVQHKVPLQKVTLGMPAAGLTTSGAVLSQSDRLGYSDYVSTHFPWLASGQLAQNLRAVDPLSAYSGNLSMRTPELDVRRADHTTSVSVLEVLAKCPYQYFVRHVLGVREPDSLERHPGRWLSSLQFGNLLHQLFFDFMTRVVERGERPDRDKHTGLIHSMLSEAIDAFREIVPSAGEVAMDREKLLLTQAVDVFLSAETGRNTDPIDFEKGFGFDEASIASIRLAEDVAIRLRGSIDRIDIGADGFEIWDYKTGGTSQYQSNLHRDKLKMQWALYAYVWSDVLRPDDSRPVSTSGYFFTSGKANGERVSAQPPDKKVFADQIRPLFEMTGEGMYPHIQVGPNACNYCSYRSMCSAERRTPKEVAAQNIFDVTAERGIAAVRKWAEH